MPRYNLRNLRIGVDGLGYVGLPLAVEFGKRFNTVGCDVKTARVDELRSGRDSTLETDEQELAEATKLTYTTRLEDLKPCRVFIVTVPTPIDDYKRTDLTPLEKSSESVGKVLKKGEIDVGIRLPADLEGIIHVLNQEDEGDEQGGDYGEEDDPLIP